MLKIEKLNFAINGKEIIKDISFKLKPGEKAVITGESGTGKTTLFRTIIGLHKPQTGTIEIDGLKIEAQNLDKIRQRICYIQQETRAIPDQTAHEFIYFPFTFKNNRHIKPDREDILEYFDRFNLKRKLFDSQMTDLSGGEKQRMAIIRGLLLKRKLILADEISTAIDPSNKEKVLDEIFNDKDLTVIAITHDETLLNKASTIISMESGKIASIERKQ